MFEIEINYEYSKHVVIHILTKISYIVSEIGHEQSRAIIDIQPFAFQAQILFQFWYNTE